MKPRKASSAKTKPTSAKEVKKKPASRQIKLKNLVVSVKRLNIPPEKLRELTGKTKRFSCVFCPRKLSTHAALLDHFTSHGKGEIDYQGKPTEQKSSTEIKCEWCPEVFPSIAKAVMHKSKRHKLDGVNYNCPQCGRSFAIRVALESHLRLEHKTTLEEATKKVKPAKHLCELCKSTFQNTEALKSHIQVAHRMQTSMMNFVFVPPPSKQVKINSAGEYNSVYYCCHCGSGYTVKFNLRKHIAVEHRQEQTQEMKPLQDWIRCKICEAIFCNKRAFDVHNNHLPDDLYLSSEELRNIDRFRVDQDFDASRVPRSYEKILYSTPKAKPASKKLLPSSMKKGKNDA